MTLDETMQQTDAEPCSIFFVGKDIHCWWDPNIGHVNRQFLETIDVRFWCYAAQLHAARLDSEDELRAAIALRQHYYHALETFFTLVAALVQAPNAVPAFIPKCSTHQLRQIIEAIQRKQQIDSLWLFERFDWEAIASIVHSGTWSTDQQVVLNQSFADAWRAQATAFLKRDSHDEYNSIKHGFRASSGGFVLAIGLEKKPDVASPTAKMSVVEQSRTGASYYVPIPVKDSATNGKTPHLVLRTKSVNWCPLETMAAIKVLSDSIQNVVSRLKILNGATGQIPFRHPNADQFAAARSAAGLQFSFAKTLPFPVAENLRTSDELRELVQELKGQHRTTAANHSKVSDEK